MAGELRAPLVIVESPSEADPALRVPLVVTEDISEGVPNIRANYVMSDPVTEGSPNMRVAFVYQEAATEGYRNLRCCFLFVESLHPVAPEEYMSTEAFPGFGNSTGDPSVPAALDPFNSALPGLSYGVHKKPLFNTRVATAANLREDRLALAQYPVWEFEISYEFLSDVPRQVGYTSLKTIMGFFLQMGGRFDSWLFKDPDDYLSEMVEMATGDGVTTEYYFMRDVGGFLEPVGQVDTVNDIDIRLIVPEAHTVPASPGPYTVTVDEAANYESDVGVTLGGTPLTKVGGAPGNMQYSVNETTGVYTFNSNQDAENVIISYQYLVDPADYTVTMPNLIVFDSAIPEGSTLYGSFQYYFVCRFQEDQMDFEKFMDKLWNLNECSFRSIV